VAKRVVFTEQARSDIRAIDQKSALQILKTLARFLESGEGNIKRLEGTNPPLLRLRTQNHRVIFRDLGDVIEIERVGNRKDVYT
jgi:mRNA interferase RelE/StbE